MTLGELVTVLESRQFISTFRDRPERPIFAFREGFVGRNGIKFGEYQITGQGEGFGISFYDTDLGLFTDIYRNIIIVVKGDNRFPISLAFSSGSNDIILEAVEIQENEI